MANIRLVSVDGLHKGADAADLTPDEVVSRVVEAQNEYSPLDNFASLEEFESFLNKDVQASSTTYFNNIDKVAPFPATGVVVIAGRPGHGKSSLMRNIALRKALAGEKVVYVSLEFSQNKEILNFISTYERRPVSIDESRGTEGYRKIVPLLKKNLLITHKLQNIEQICASLSSESFRGATLVLDYVQKIGSSSSKAEGAGSEAQIRAVCNALNKLVIDNDLLILLGSQLTQAADRSPVFDVVKGGRTIEEVASVVLRIWRHGISEMSSLNDMGFAKGSYNFTIDVLKNRESPAGSRIGLYTVGGLSLADDRNKEIKDDKTD